MKKFILPTLTVLGVVLGIIIGMALSQKANAQRIIYQNGTWQLEQSKVDRLLQLMETAYVDDLDIDSITDEVMSELVQKLDPHSAYIPKEDLEIVNSELAGSFSGIGVQFTIQQDTVRIVAVIAGGPCEGVGVLAGDKLVSVDDSAFVGKKMNNEKVMKTLRGPKGTQVKLGVLRAGTKEPLYFTVTRGDIPVTSVDAKFIIEQNGKKIGFVRVNKFGETTYKEFISALADLYAKGATSYIVDLRENSGGYMEQLYRGSESLRSTKSRLYRTQYTFRYKRFLASASASFTFRRDEIEQTWFNEVIDNRTYKVFSWLNGADSHIFGGALRLGWLGKVMTANLSVESNHTTRTLRETGEVKQSDDWRLTADAAAHFSRGWTLSGDMRYQSKVSTFFSIFKQYCVLNARIQKDFKKVSLFLEGRDLLDRPMESEFISADEKEVWTESTLHNRRLLRLGCNWRF